MSPKSKKDVKEFEAALQDQKTKKYILCLYVAGVTTRSKMAITNIRAICDENLRGRYELEVIDIYQQPALASREQIIATPTLIKKLPLPLRRFFGTMADKERILVGLDLEEGSRKCIKKDDKAGE